MIIERGSRPTRDFTIVPNDMLRDARLGFKSRGLLATILHYPPGFRVSSDTLASGRDGRDSVRAALRELEDAGYVERKKSQDDQGRWSTRLIVNENGSQKVGDPSAAPTTDFPASVEPPTPGFPASVGPAPENPALKEQDYRNKTTSPNGEVKRVGQATRAKVPAYLTDGPADAAIEAMTGAVPGLSRGVAAEYRDYRRKAKQPLSASAWARIAAEIGRATASGWAADSALTEAMDAGWRGLKAEWLENRKGRSAPGADGVARTRNGRPILSESTTGHRAPGEGVIHAI